VPFSPFLSLPGESFFKVSFLSLPCSVTLPGFFFFRRQRRSTPRFSSTPFYNYVSWRVSSRVPFSPYIICYRIFSRRTGLGASSQPLPESPLFFERCPHLEFSLLFVSHPFFRRKFPRFPASYVNPTGVSCREHFSSFFLALREQHGLANLDRGPLTLPFSPSRLTVVYLN